MPPKLRQLLRAGGAEGASYVLLEQVIRGERADLFPGQTILEAAAFRVTRDSELDLDD